jgi:hypothetical protein
MKKENLQRMADYIRAIPQEKFDMCIFREGGISDTECDSVGCVIGHCTILDAENIKARFVGPSGAISFARWSEGFTGLDKHGSDGNWTWCFDSRWGIIDNTPEGAALRIEWLINNGVPKDAYEQIKGYAKLCYR